MRLLIHPHAQALCVACRVSRAVYHPSPVTRHSSLLTPHWGPEIPYDTPSLDPPVGIGAQIMFASGRPAWQIDRERAAMAGCALDADMAAVGLDDLADHAQPQAAAVDLRGDRVLAAIERLEDMREIGRRDAHAAILHGDGDLPPLLDYAQPDPAARTTVFD